MNARRLVKVALAHLVPDSIYSAINSVVATRDIASGKRWEPEIALLPRFVSPGDTVIDIGGNHGLYTYHLSRLVGASGCVHSFEPLPPNLRILNHTVKSLGLHNVIIHPTACGEEQATATFCVPLDHGVPQLGWAHQGSNGVNFECTVVGLDGIIDTKVSFIKCDIEGAELFALRGAEQILRLYRPVLLIEAGNQTLRFGYAQQAVFDYAGELGYRFFKGSLEEQATFTETGNYFFIPAELSPKLQAG